MATWVNPDKKEYILYDLIYVKSQTRQTSSWHSKLGQWLLLETGQAIMRRVHKRAFEMLVQFVGLDSGYISVFIFDN